MIFDGFSSKCLIFLTPEPCFGASGVMYIVSVSSVHTAIDVHFKLVFSLVKFSNI